MSTVIAIAIPAYLVSRLSQTVYAAWVLILQLATYVSFLDLITQTAIAKFIAEHDAKGDEKITGQFASVGFMLTSCAAILGLILTGLVSWQVPRLFGAMPVAMYKDVRVSLGLVGVSLSVALWCSVFSGIFVGLHRYDVPSALLIANRILIALSIWLVVGFNGGLCAMAAAVAAANISTAAAQAYLWRRLAARVHVAVTLIALPAVKQMARYSLYLTIWSAGMLLVSGLDVTIVGHYDFDHTTFYSIAVMPTNFFLLVISSVLGPMMPASSAMSTERSPTQMGALMIRMTRYTVTLLIFSGLPLILLASPILEAWVGTQYALGSAVYLRVLVAANMVRNLCLPYSTIIVATGRQREATIATIAEAVVNLTSSIYFASRYGAIGVAYGTLIGSGVSVCLHFLISMPATQQTLSFVRRRLIFDGFVIPGTVLIPPVLVLILLRFSYSTTTTILFATVAALASIFMAWFFVVEDCDRRNFLSHAKGLLSRVKRFA